MPVNSRHADYTKFLPKWERCRDVCAGQDAVHAGGEKYLPKLKDQLPDDYKAYVARATFYNATWRTVAGLTGMVFRKPPKVEVPEGMKDTLFKDIDGTGKPFQMILEEVTIDALRYNRKAVLVDYPKVPPGLTMAQAQELNLRPFMKTYSAFDVINWLEDSIDNRKVPVLVVLQEKKWEGTDEFSGEFKDRWRVLDLVGTNEGRKYRQRVFKRTGAQQAGGGVDQFVQDGPDIYPLMNNQPLKYIPIRIISADDTGFDVDDPPLIDLVDTNLAHYRMSADYEHGCHFTALPTLFLAGFKQEIQPGAPPAKVYIGSEAAITSSSPDAKATFVEFSGAGLAAIEKNLDRKEMQMAVLGARMLEPQKRAVETEETTAIHRKGEESLLASIATNVGLAMTDCTKWFVEWAGGDPTNVLVELNKNFFPTPMSPQMLSALLSGWQQGAPGFSDQSLFDQLKAGEIVSEDADLEEEQTRIADKQQEQQDRALEDQAKAIKMQQELVGEPAGGPPQGGA